MFAARHMRSVLACCARRALQAFTHALFVLALSLALAFGLALASVAAPAPRARALTAPAPPPSPWTMSVVPLEASVAPRNTRIWVTFSEATMPGGPDVALLDQNGTRVPLSASVLSAASESRWWWRMLVLAPSEPLARDARYTVHVRKRDGELAVPAQTFITNDVVDLAAPVVPVVEDVHYTPPQAGARCGTGESLTVSLAADTWIVTRAPDMDGLEPFDPGAPSGALADMFLNTGVADLGSGSCPSATWPHGAMQLGTFDLAGNFSGWGERTRFGVEDGCRVRAPGSRLRGWQPGAWLVAVLLALRIRRTAGRRRAER